MFLTARLALAATNTGKFRANYRNLTIIIKKNQELDRLREENRILAIKIEKEREFAKLLDEIKKWLRTRDDN